MTKRQMGKGKKGRPRRPKPGGKYQRIIRVSKKVEASSTVSSEDLVPDPTVYKKKV